MYGDLGERDAGHRPLEHVKLRAEAAWATIQGVARQLEHGVIGPDRTDAVTTEAFSAFERAWTI